MNQPPETFVRVPVEDLHTFVTRAGRAAGLAADQAERLAGLLTDNDARGVFSHGTRQIATYARLMRDGVLNPAPEPYAVQETASSLLMDGDGGLGYFPAFDGTLRLIEKAEAQGIKVVMNRCPKIEYAKLSGEIGWNGINSGTISSKKPIMRQGFQSFGIRQK